MKTNSFQKTLSAKKSKSMYSKTNSFLISLSKWKNLNKIWVKNQDFFQKHQSKEKPSLEIVLYKQGAIKKHKRILSVFDDKIICYKSIEDKNLNRIHAMILFEDQLLIHWLYKKSKKQENLNKKFTGLNLLNGSKFVRFISNDQNAILELKDFLKLRIKSVDFQDEFELIKIIGKGSFSSVYLAQKIETKAYYAVKVFNKRKYYANPNGKESVTNEIICMKKTSNHQNILKLLEIYETHQNIFLCLEMISGGNLQDRFDEKTIYNEKNTKEIMKGIFEGLKYIHSVNIMHRDLKPTNILLRSKNDEEKDICIADFGLATPCDSHPFLFFRCGTPGFAAPEIIDNHDPNKKYDSVCDIFSAGVIFHKLLIGKQLFKSKNENILYLNKECQINFFAAMYRRLSESALDLLKRTLEKNPEKRITASDALIHPFFQTTLKKIDSSTFLLIPDEKHEVYDPVHFNNYTHFNYEEKKNNIWLGDKSFSLTQQSKNNLEDLISHTPVLNGYLNTYEIMDSGVALAKNNSYASRLNIKTTTKFSKYLPANSLQKIEKKGAKLNESGI